MDFIIFALAMALVVTWVFLVFNYSANKCAESCTKLSQQQHPYIASPGPTTPIQELPINPSSPLSQTPGMVTYIRDQQVLSNPLYPPLNRQDTSTMARLMAEPRLQPTSTTGGTPNDQYRIIAYLVNTVDKNDVWKLFARNRDGTNGRRTNTAFYVASANKNIDVKFVLTSDMLDGGTARLRDIYDLPEYLVIRHPLFAQVPYEVATLPSADLSDFASGYF